MFRILFFVVVVFLLGLGFAWLAERPGDMIITFGGYRYEVTLMVAAVLVVAVVAMVMILWWIVRSIWNSPYTVARYFRVRRRDRGYQALSTGMIAAGAGDGGLAGRMGKQAHKMLSADQEPLILLLEAQAALLEGDYPSAREKFAAMAEDPETRLLGLRGLYLEAERLGEREAARHYAQRAAEAAPQLNWAVNSALEARTEEGDWQGALSLVDAQKNARAADKEALARRRAVLLTAQAMEQLDADPAAARTAALEAHRLQPAFVPAAVTAAKALFRQGDLRRGSKVLETAWKEDPHPEVADAYVHARPGDSTHDRLARARKLRRIKANHVESELAVARAALDAGEYREARAAAEAAVRLAPRESAFLLLADIEEAETGDQGRVRHWLARAVRAPRDPAWVADGFVSEHWAPASPVTGRIDAFEWRAPMERLGQVVEGEDALSALPAITAARPAEERAADRESVASETPEKPATQQEPDAPAEPEETKAAEAPRAEEETAAPDDADVVDLEPVSGEEDAAEKSEEAAKKSEEEKSEDEATAEERTPPPPPPPQKEAAQQPSPPRPEEEKPLIPDDPGIEPEEEKAGKDARFRLF